MGKKQLSVTLDEETVEELEEIREETGVPVSQQIEMRLNGYEIRKSEQEEVAAP